MAFDKVNCALAGCGFWGPNFVRIIQNSEFARLTKICDLNISRLSPFVAKNPDLLFTQNLEDIISDPEIEAVVVCTPADTHFDITKRLLLAGKHVLCEKPLANTEAECRELYDISLQSDRKLLVGHVFEYNHIVKYMKQLIARYETGDILYMQFSRMGLGPSRTDASVVFDLASHDVSMATSLLGKEPIAVTANGSCLVHKELEDIAFIQLEFADKVFANINVSWIDPVKERIVKVVGTKKMLLFDDLSLSAKLKIIDMGSWFQANSIASRGARVSVKDGETVEPSLPDTEPLITEFNHFIACIKGEEQPLTDASYAAGVIKVLEAVRTSIENGGKKIILG